MIIVVGVLIAFAVQNWNEGRVARDSERQYLERIAADLARDTTTFGFVLDVAEEMSQALDHVQVVLASEVGEPIDTVRFLNDVLVGARFGWNTPLYARATLDDLLSTGNLSLIRDTQLRDALVEYYRSTDDVRVRIERRRGDYALAGFQIVPITVAPGVSGPYVFDPAGTDQPLAAIVRSVRESELPTLITGQQNLTDFLAFMHTRQQSSALELLALLEEHLQ